MIQAYQKAFPELFTPATRCPSELRQHFRYPEDLFRVQTDDVGQVPRRASPTTSTTATTSGTSRRTPAPAKKPGSTNTAVDPDGQELTGTDQVTASHRLPADAAAR